MKLSRWLLNPSYLMIVLFGSQLLFWYFAMPEFPVLARAAGKYVSEQALFRYLLFLLCLLLGTMLGQFLYQVGRQSGSHRVNYTKLTSSIQGTTINPASIHMPALERRASMLLKIAQIGLLFAAIGELSYTKPIWENPSLIVDNVSRGYWAGIGGAAMRDTDAGGLRTLINIVFVPVAIYSMLSFHTLIRPHIRRRSQRNLLILGGAIIVHALLLSARMFAIYYATIVLAAYLLFNPSRRIPKKALTAVVFMIVSVVWLNALLRDGYWYSTVNAVPVWSHSVQQYTWTVLVEGYLASDLNNAMIVFDCRPDGQMVSSTMFKSLQMGSGSYSACPNWYSSFGTVNSLALWWFDWGWFGAVVAVTMGIWLGFIYRLAASHYIILSPAVIFFLLSYPGIYSLLRINYFLLAIFVVPAVFLSTSLIWMRLRMLTHRRAVISNSVPSQQMQ